MHLAESYRVMATIRCFEERLVALKAEGAIQGSMHLCCGQEAIPVGACSVLLPRDALTATYRGHGWAIARGVPMTQLFAELLGRDSSLCGGRAGSAQLSSAEHGFLGENAIVGAGLPIALGAAIAANWDEGAVSLVSVGDGALNQGGAHEALNMAGVMKVPLIIVVENNGYAELTPSDAMVPTKTLAERASIYGMEGTRVDGNDVDAVATAVGAAVEQARGGGGPSLIEAMTTRLVGHYDLDQQLYRPKGEIEEARRNEPLERLRSTLGDDVSAEVTAAANSDVEAALTEALAIPFPDPGGARDHLYA